MCQLRKAEYYNQANQYPMPRVDDLLDRLGRAQHISPLELWNWQILVEEGSQERTTFVTR